MSDVKLNTWRSISSWQGQDGDGCTSCSTARSSSTRAAADGRENLLSVLGQGEMFGELSLFDLGRRNLVVPAR